MNKVQILGTITRDIQLSYSASGSAIANFGIAYNDKWKDQQGQMKEKAHFFDVSVFGKQAETINQYFHKGSRILIGGSLDFQSWEKDGQKHSKVVIKMNDFSFIDRKSDEQQQPYNPNTNPTQNMANTPPPQYQHTDYQPRPEQQQPPSPATLPQIDIDETEIPF